MQLTNSISNWFLTAKPAHTVNDLNVQLGVHIEEIAEMFDVLVSIIPPAEVVEGEEGEDSVQMVFLQRELHDLANSLKKGLIQANLHRMNREQRIAMLDSLCDQVVTGNGVATFADMDFGPALNEVNVSNWSKFEDGNPVFDENTKMKKGKDYRPAVLDDYV